MWGALQWMLDNWAKLTGGIAGTGAVGTLYVTLGGPYPVTQYHVEGKIIEVQGEMVKLRSPLRALQIGQIEGQIGRLEAEQDTLLADKARMAIELPKMTDPTARRIVEQRVQEIDARSKRVAKDILRLEQDVAVLRSTNANAPAP